AGLKAIAGDSVRIVGMGGPAMAAQGLDTFFPLSDTAVMGLREVVPSIPVIDYVAPQVWASRQYRARAMARNFDLLLALLPFEPPFFEKYGLHTVFVGHPVIERAKKMTGGPELRARLGIAAGAPVLCVLPGSRTSEIRFILPV